MARIRAFQLGFDDAYGAQYLAVRHAFGALRAVRDLRSQLDDEKAQALESLNVVERQLRVSLKQLDLPEPTKERREPPPVSAAVALGERAAPHLPATWVLCTSLAGLLCLVNGWAWGSLL